MSGYLHRLLHTVSQPRETVHPRTGSLFAPHRSATDSPLGSIEQADTVPIHPARPEFDTAAESADPVRPPARLGDTPSLLVPEITIELPRQFESDRRAEPPRAARSEAQPDTSEAAVHMPRPLAAPQESRAIPDSGRQADVPSYETLMPPQRTEGNSTRPVSPRFLTEASSTRREALRFSTEAVTKKEAKPNFQVPGRPTRVERQPDDIQIHIGRIEVTAVQAPAPRAPQPPGNGISLDAYLQRRNGRPR